MAEIYKSLNYEHNEINNLLKKIETNHVLTADEYDKLIKKIGLNKLEKLLENFDGTYDSLTGRPNIHEIAAKIAMEYFDALRSEMLTLVNEGDSDVREDFMVELAAFHELLFNLEDGVITLDEKFKEELQKELDEYMVLLSELETKTEELEIKKANDVHFHETKDIVNLNELFDNFEIKVKENYHLEELNNKTHTHPKEVMNITPEQIKKWDEKASLKHIQDLRGSITEIKDDYVTTTEVKDCIDDLKEDLGLYMLKDDCLDLLDERAYINHIHEIRDINRLSDLLDSKVNKEINKVLIDKKTLEKIKTLLAQQELLQNGKQEHIHDNLPVLNTITEENVDKWNTAITELRVKELITEELKDIDLGGEIPVNLENRLNGLTFMPLTTEEFNNLSEDEKEDSTIVYIITDSKSYEQDMSAYVTNGQLDSILRELLNNGSILTNEVLDNRLDGMTLKKVAAAEYNKDNKEDNILYVITDADEIDMTLYLTKEDFKKRISDPATSTNRPVNPAIGQCCFDTTLNKPIWFNGSVWVDALGNPV